MCLRRLSGSLGTPLHFIESTEVATTVIHLGKGDIDDFLFMRSSKELLDQFSKFTSPLLERMVIASKEIEILAELRDTLLPKLISGCATSATMVPNDLIH